VSRRPLRFVRVARKVAVAIGPDDCLLAGGVAVMAPGFVRVTRAVDLLTRLPLPEARKRLERSGFATRVLKGDVPAGRFSCLKGECDGLPFDVLPQLVPIHWEAALPVEARGAGPLRVVPLGDLMALKLKAQGPKDLMDAAILVLMHPEIEPRARALAIAYRIQDHFEAWLDHPRTRAQAREEAAQEARRPGEPGGRPEGRA
jgi:hypothetical protein